MRHSEMSRAREKALDALKKEWEAAATMADRHQDQPKRQVKADAAKRAYEGLQAYHNRTVAKQDLETEEDDGDGEDQSSLPWEN